MSEVADARLRRRSTPKLTTAEIGTIRAILDAAFGADEEERFAQTDWDNALGGTHFVIDTDEGIAGHAAVVERVIEIGGRPFRTGYVEAVAVAPDRQGRGLGTVLMREVTAWIEPRYELGVLGTGRHAFYERLGWTTWRGPAFVRTPDGPRRTPDEEGFILVFRTASTPPFDLDATISCDWRPGDVW
jgi:aminoglycoside 2'-N-acetyltransferase I